MRTKGPALGATEKQVGRLRHGCDGKGGKKKGNSARTTINRRRRACVLHSRIPIGGCQPAIDPQAKAGELARNCKDLTVNIVGWWIRCQASWELRTEDKLVKLPAGRGQMQPGNDRSLEGQGWSYVLCQ